MTDRPEASTHPHERVLHDVLRSRVVVRQQPRQPHSARVRVPVEPREVVHPTSDPANRVQRVRYDVASDTLRSLDLLNAGATPVPLASNIVNLKFQYGIDTDNNGYLDTWVPATGAWAPAQMMVAPNDKLNQIKAIRMAIVVRTEQFDRDMGDWKPPQPLFTDCGSAACPAPLDITIVKSTSPVGNFRYRTYENVVPLRNNVWNFIKG